MVSLLLLHCWLCLRFYNDHMKRFAAGYEFFARIIMMILVTHIAFLVHTLLGLIIVGLHPSIAATYGTYRAWALDVKDRHWTVKRMWMTFHNLWKSELKKANLLGWPITLIWALLIWEYWLTQTNYMGQVGYAVSGFLLLLNFLFGLFALLVWVIEQNFSESLWWDVKMAAQMSIARPVCSIFLILILIVTVWLYWKLPGLAIALGISLPVYLIVMVVYAFGRLQGMDVHVLEPHTKRSKK